MTDSPLWSIALSLMGLGSTWLLSQKLKIGWVVAVVMQCVWFVYGLVTGQVSFSVVAVVYTLISIRGWRRWRDDERAA